MCYTTIVMRDCMGSIMRGRVACRVAGPLSIKYLLLELVDSKQTPCAHASSCLLLQGKSGRRQPTAPRSSRRRRSTAPRFRTRCASLCSLASPLCADAVTAGTEAAALQGRQEALPHPATFSFVNCPVFSRPLHTDWLQGGGGLSIWQRLKRF